MNRFEQFLVEFLQGRITYEGSPVEVRREFQPPTDNLPCITLDTGIGDTTRDYRRTLSGGEKLVYHRESEIQVNLWTNTEDERENIAEQIKDLYTRLINHDYIFCSKYQRNGQCSTLNSACPAGSLYSDARALKRQCPQPDLYQYEWMLKAYGIYDGTFILEPPFRMDELDLNPPLLRYVFRAHCEYREVLSTRGVPSEEVEFL